MLFHTFAISVRNVGLCLADYGFTVATQGNGNIAGHACTTKKLAKLRGIKNCIANGEMTHAYLFCK